MFMFMPIVGLDSDWAYEPGSGPEQEKINVKRDVRGSPTAQMTNKKKKRDVRGRTRNSASSWS